VLGFVVGLASAAMVHWPSWGELGLALILAGAGLMFDYGLVMERGARPFPTAPHSTLRDVLKALYLQQAFTRFAVAQQGAPPAQLRTAFAAFIAQVQPDNLDAPTQPPGVVRSSFEPAVADG